MLIYKKDLNHKFLNNTYQQIIKLLIRLGKEHGKELNDGRILLKAEFTNRDLANMIGTTRETVSRTLTNLKKSSILKQIQRTILFLTLVSFEEELFS